MDLGLDLTGKEDVNWDEVEEALTLLANNQINEISLSQFDGWESILASGENGLVTIAYFDNRNHKDATLINMEAKNIEYEMKIGRQKVPINDELLVSIEIARKVFKAYFDGLDIFSLEGLKWEIQ